jgi:hypothetical protein
MRPRVGQITLESFQRNLKGSLSLLKSLERPQNIRNEVRGDSASKSLSLGSETKCGAKSASSSKVGGANCSEDLVE